MNPQRTELINRLQEVTDLRAAAYLLGWDQSTYMPPGGATARGRQLGLLQRLAQEKFTDPAIGRLLDELQPYADSLPYDDDDAALIRVTRRQYERAIKTPPAFTAELAQHGAASYAMWSQARPANDFAALRPYLEKTLELSRRYADFFPGYAHPADPLIEGIDYGMSVAILRPLFAELRTQLSALVQTISRQGPVDDACLYQPFPEDKQLAFALEIAQHFGYDLQRGRQDQTLHPFAAKFSLGDVRITTRVRANDLREPLFVTMHEAGHALYEQGIAAPLDGTPLGAGTSAGVHESQSRLWENVVGRSHGFWQHYYPRLQATFPDQLGQTSLETFYRAINKVQPTLIRVNADELTYNLHVIIRFELELALLEGALAVADLPAAWRAAYAENLGVTAPDDRDGVLQDVHWYAFMIGGVFQGYTLGNIMAAQFYAAALRAHPTIPDEIAAGNFTTLYTWLREQIYQHGSKFTTAELLERVTGERLTLQPYLAYLRSKYGTIHRLSFAGKPT
jgi:carboxypeptidase Taq